MCQRRCGRTVQAQQRAESCLSFSAGQFTHHRQAPSAALSDWVEQYWHVRWDLRCLPVQQQATLPHPNGHQVAERRQEQLFGIKFKPGGFHPFCRQP